VLDLGCGYGEFINNIAAARKWAMDLNPEARAHLKDEVEFVQQDCSQPSLVPDGSLDVVFTSNFFEHLPDKACLSRTLRHAFRALKPGGQLIALGPNIKFLPRNYWDFYDHHIILTDVSLTEALEIEGFAVERAIARFLPYTLVKAPEYPLLLVRLYLLFPCLWWVMGRQFLLRARKPARPPA